MQEKCRKMTLLGGIVVHEKNEVNDDRDIVLSFIIPVYNCEESIEKCVYSILCQGMMHSEIIIVDDNSTDGSLDICKRLEKNNRQIKVIHLPENSGATTARITGLYHSKCNYISFIDSDDYISEDYVQVVMRIIESQAPDIISFNHYIVKGNSITEHISFTEDIQYDRKQIEDLLFPNLICNDKGECLPCSLWGSVFNKQIVMNAMKATDPRIRIGEDEVCVKTCYYMASSVSFIRNNLYYYSINDGSLTQVRKPRLFDDAYLKYNNFVSNLDVSKYEFKDQLNRELVNTLYNIAMTQFYSTECTLKTRKRTIKELERPIYKEAIKKGKFTKNSKSHLKQLLLRYHLLLTLLFMKRIKGNQ